MISRIIEAFTKPKMEITAVDELIHDLTILGIIIIILFIIAIIFLIKETIEDEKKRKDNEKR